jgi:heme exporter protein C
MDKRTTNALGFHLAAWKWLLLPLMAAVILMCYLWAGDLKPFQSPVTARIIFWHVPMAILSMVWFAAAAVYAGRYLWRKAAFDDTRSVKSAEVGLVLTVLATVTGAIFSKMQWAGVSTAWYQGYWQWDPKQTAIALVIVIYLAYFGLRASVEDPRTRANVSAVYALLAFAAVPFLYYVLPLLPGTSVHPTQVINTREGMDTPYRTTFWLSTLTFLAVSIWAYQLQLRVERLADRVPSVEAAVEPRMEAVRKPVPEG